MKKCLPITLLVSLLCFGAGCTPKNTSSTGGNTPTSSSVAPQVTVSSVEIEYDGETTVLAGSTAKLSAEAKMSDGSKGKVVWSTSDENVAKVTNGTVAFKNVLEDATVTITATSKDDSSKSASVTFEVKFTAINFANSRGNFDSSLYLEENSVIVEKGDSALLFNEVHGTKWYVEADVTPSTDLGTETDQFPKFGIMTGSDANGYWNTECKNLFYFVDATNPATTNSWTSIGFVGQNDTNSDWNWGGIQAGSVSTENKFAKEETTKMGLMRDGVHYYLFAGNGDGYGVVKHIVNEHFAADEATYAWFGGWQSAYTLSNPTYLIGDEIDSKYEAVSTITLGSYEQTLYINDTYQIDYKVDTDMYNPSKLTFTSANPEVATVNSTGLVTAGGAAGTTTITVAYEDVKAEFAVEVTTDALFKVELDGQMSDLLWNENVKTNKYTLEHKSGTKSSYFDLYASKNSRGIYLFADYYTKEDHTGAVNWWEGDNFELRFNSPTAVLTNDTEPETNKHQYWISRYNGAGASNMSAQFVTAPELNEETGYYEIKFEAFISYKKASIDADTLVGLTAGYNPGGGDNWTAGPNFATNDFALTSKITTNGLVQYYTEDVMCSEEHTYNSRVTKEVTCVTDGETTYTCKYCGHTYTEPIVAVGEHNFNEPVEYVASTCTTAGHEVLGCAGCEEEKTNNFEINPENHTGTYDYATGTWSCCNSTTYATVDRFNAGGWGDVNTWTYLAKDLAGDFEVVTTFELETNGVVGNWWRGALPIVQHELPEGSEGEGSPWVTRFDWWGWCDQWQSTEKLTNDWNPDEGDLADDSGNRDIWWTNAEGNNIQGSDFETSMTKGTIVWTCKRTGTVVENSFVITSDAGTFTYSSKATDVSADKNLSIALASEFAKYTVKKVEM